MAGIGTGGTITGVGQVIKERKPGVQIIAVEPEESPILTAAQPGPHKIQGIGANFVPEILDRDIYDEVIDVNAETPSSGPAAPPRRRACSSASPPAPRWPRPSRSPTRPENAGKTIVVVIPSFGERYLSTILFSDLMD